MNRDDATAQRRLYLRASVKALVVIGFGFLLVPFFGSIPWPRAELPPGSTLVAATALAPGQTRAFTLADGHTVFVTRNSPALQAALQATPVDRLWSGTAPGALQQDWFVLRARTALEEPVEFLPAAGAWPGGFVAANGGAWDLAGRALKPGPGHPSGYAGKLQNLPPMPFRRHDDGIALLPLPRP